MLKKIVIMSVAFFLVGGMVAFAASQQEAAVEDWVTIRRDYRGQDPATWDLDYIAENDVVFNQIQDKFKVNLEFPFCGGDYQVVLAGMASGDVGDIVDAWPGHPSLPYATWRKWISDGVVVDLKKLVDENPGRYPVAEMLFDDPVYKLYNLQKNGDEEAYYAMFDGWYVKRVHGAIAYNGYLLRELGLEVPETYDEFINAIKLARRELGVSGYGWCTYKGTSFGYINPIFFHPDGLQIDGFWQDDEGNWYDATIDPRNKAKWEELQGYGEAGLFHARWLTGELWDYMDDLIAGKHLSGTYKGPSPSQYLYFWDQFKGANPDAVMEEDFPQGPYPLKGPKGTGQKYAIPFNVRRVNFIPAFSENPERAFDVLHYTFTEEFQNMRWYGVKGVHYTKDDKSDFNLRKLFETSLDVFTPGGRSFEEVDPMRIMSEWFYNTTNYNAGIVEFEKYGSYFDAHKNYIDMRWIRSRDHYATKGNTVEVYENFLREGWTALPQWQGFIALTDEDTQIQAALSDVKIKWFVAFLLGNKDVDTEWDNFVREYKAKGADKLLAAWSAKAVEAQTMWEDVVGK